VVVLEVWRSKVKSYRMVCPIAFVFSFFYLVEDTFKTEYKAENRKKEIKQ